MTKNNHQIADYDAVIDAEFGTENMSEQIVAAEKAYTLYAGKVLADARKNVKITQVELAQRMKCSRSYISRIERGLANPKFSIYHRMMNALGYRMDIVVP